MNGRKLFRLIKPVILFFACFLSVLPRSVRYFLLSFFSSMPTVIGVFFRYILLKSIAKKCGDNVYVGRWCTLKSIEKLVIGDNVSIHEYCYLDAQGEIIIGSDVSIAHNCSLISFEHTFSDSTVVFKYQPLLMKKIQLESNVWLGCGVRVLGGTTIKTNCIVAANSVTKGNLPSGAIYGGAPAKEIKKL